MYNNFPSNNVARDAIFSYEVTANHRMLVISNRAYNRSFTRPSHISDLV